MSRTLIADGTSQSITLRVTNALDEPITSLAWNTAGLEIRFKRGATGTWNTITLASLANDQAAWTSGGFVHMRNGKYRLDITDASAVSGVPNLQFELLCPSALGTRTIDADFDLDPEVQMDADGKLEVVVDGYTDTGRASLLTGTQIESGLTMLEWLRLAGSALFGRTAGFTIGVSGTGTFMDYANSKPRITVNYDVNGNRTSLTRDPS